MILERSVSVSGSISLQDACLQIFYPSSYSNIRGLNINIRMPPCGIFIASGKSNNTDFVTAALFAPYDIGGGYYVLLGPIIVRDNDTVHYVVQEIGGISHHKFTNELNPFMAFEVYGEVSTSHNGICKENKIIWSLGVYSDKEAKRSAFVDTRINHNIPIPQAIYPALVLPAIFDTISIPSYAYRTGKGKMGDQMNNDSGVTGVNSYSCTPPTLSSLGEYFAGIIQLNYYQQQVESTIPLRQEPDSDSDSYSYNYEITLKQIVNLP